MKNHGGPAVEPDPTISALFANAQQIVELRRDEPTERASEMVEWLSSEGWARLVRHAREDEFEVVWATVESLEPSAMRAAIRWAVVELSRLEP